METTIHSPEKVNVGVPERWASLIGGSALTIYGLTKRSPGGIAMAVAGGFLLYRGATRHCFMYEATGVNTADRSVEGESSAPTHRGIKVEKSLTINRPAEELYRFWRNFENLPRFMRHLEAVHVQDGNRSHWVAKAPLGAKVEWDAEIINDEPNRLIAWRSLEGSDIDNAGSVNFRPSPDGASTVVDVVVRYAPPGGAVGATIAKLLGEEPSLQIEEDLTRFKQLMETGEITTADNMPA